MPVSQEIPADVFAKSARRLIPFMALLYIIGFIDRSNVGFAALTMNRDLGFSPGVFGLGASMFFLGYLTFQIPTALLLARAGARRVIMHVYNATAPLFRDVVFQMSKAEVVQLAVDSVTLIKELAQAHPQTCLLYTSPSPRD